MKFGIIGYGRFGKLWASCLEAYGDIKVYDKNISAGSVKEVVNCDFLFILVPIGNFKEVCESLKDKVPLSTVIVDACSVKMHPSDTMLRVFPQEQTVIATHPLFGPDSVSRLGLAGRKIVLCPLRGDLEKMNELKKIFRAMQLEIFECTPQEHDLQMARSQALVHFLGRGLAALKLEKQELYTPDYEALLRIHDVVNNDTWQLFFDMQRYNPFTGDVREKLLEKLADLNFEIEDPVDLGTARTNIEKIDQKIIQLLGQRFKQSQKIGELKKESGVEVLDPEREESLKAQHRAAAEKYGVEENLTDILFGKIMETSRNNQRNI